MARWKVRLRTTTILVALVDVVPDRTGAALYFACGPLAASALAVPGGAVLDQGWELEGSRRESKPLS